MIVIESYIPAEKGDIFEQREQAWISSGRGDNWTRS
jgi:hypothetical protein